MPNAKVLESKKAIVDELTGKIQGASAVVFVDYTCASSSGTLPWTTLS